MPKTHTTTKTLSVLRSPLLLLLSHRTLLTVRMVWPTASLVGSASTRRQTFMQSHGVILSDTSCPPVAPADTEPRPGVFYPASFHPPVHLFDFSEDTFEVSINLLEL